MTDPIELRLRTKLQVAALPSAPPSLRAYLHDLPATTPARRTWQPGALLIAATIAMLLLIGLTILVVGSRPPAPTPTPGPDREGLLRDLGALNVRLERSFGDASAPVSADTSSQEVDLGEFVSPGPFVIGAACRGPGDMRIDVHAPPGTGPFPSGTTGPSVQPPFGDYAITCDGDVEHFEYPSATAWGGEGNRVVLTVARGASWRIAAGEYEVAAPILDSPNASEGFTPLSLIVPFSIVTVLSPTGGTVSVPDGATRLGVIVRCTGTATLSVSFNASTDSPDAPTPALGSRTVECPTAAAGGRVEFAAPAGQRVDVRVTTSGAVWARLLVEANADYVRPTAPPLPDGIADVVWAATGTSTDGSIDFAVGRLGSSGQTLAGTGDSTMVTAAGEYVLVNSTTKLDLWSVDPLRRVRTIVEVPAPGWVGEAWLDTVNQRIYYVVADESGAAPALEVRRVAIDGTGDILLDRLVATVSGSGARLAVDGSVFIVDYCEIETECERRVYDTATDDLRTFTVSRGIDCFQVGVAAATVVSQCYGIDSTRLIATNLDGTSERVLVEGQIAAAVVVETDAGASLVYQLYLPGADAEGSWIALDLRTGASRTLLTFSSEEPTLGVPGVEPLNSLYPVPVSLPPNWLLLGSQLGEFLDGHLPGDRPVPLLINVVTGETIEMVHLAH